MRQPLRYLTILFAVSYFLFYLQGGSWYAVTGILMILVFSGLSLLEAEQPGRMITLLLYASAAVSLVFTGFLIYSSIHILLDALDHDYFPLSVILLSAFSILFAILILSNIIYTLLVKA